jgi:hypothetical protein
MREPRTGIAAINENRPRENKRKRNEGLGVLEGLEAGHGRCCGCDSLRPAVSNPAVPKAGQSQIPGWSLTPAS